MTEPRDPGVRALVAELVGASPPAPTFDEITAVEPYLRGASDTGRPRRSPVRWTAIGVAVAALTGGTVFAAQGMGEDGSATPEAAVERLIEAAEASDALGILEALPPSERDVLRDPLLDVEDELTRLGVLDEGFDAGGVAGASAQVADDVVLRAEPLTDDLVAVHVEGATSWSFDPAAFPFGEQAAEAFDVDADERIDADLQETFDGDLVVAAVREGGRWHASLGYTVAELARRSGDDDGDLAFPAGRSVSAVGADSPEAAAESFLRASLRYDVQRMIELLEPTEAAVLHDYGPLLVDAAEEFGAPPLEVSGVQLSVEGDGDERRVVVQRAAWTATYEDEDGGGGSSRAEIDGACLRGESTSTYDGQQETYPFDSCSADEELSRLFAPGEVAYEVRQVDGRWFVRPVASVGASALGQLRSLGSADELDSLPGIGLVYFHVLGPFLPFGGMEAGTDEITCSETTVDGEVRACPEEGVTTSTIPADEVAEGCSAVYEALPAEATEEQYEAAEQEYQRCLDQP